MPVDAEVPSVPVVTAIAGVDPDLDGLGVLRLCLGVRKARDGSIQSFWSASALSLDDGDRVTPCTVPPGYAVQSLTYGSLDLLREPFRFAGDSSAPVRLTLRRTVPDAGRRFRIAGRVAGWPRGTTGRIRLLLGDYRATIEARILEDGSFAFEGLASGAYQLQVIGGRPTARVIVSRGDVTNVVVSQSPGS